MPDRYGENRDREPETTLADRYAAAELRARAIAECHLCDPNGYLGSTVCDHTDHAEAARRGMAMIREKMGWDR